MTRDADPPPGRRLESWAEIDAWLRERSEVLMRLQQGFQMSLVEEASGLPTGRRLLGADERSAA